MPAKNKIVETFFSYSDFIRECHSWSIQLGLTCLPAHFHDIWCNTNNTSFILHKKYQKNQLYNTISNTNCLVFSCNCIVVEKVKCIG